MGSPRLVIRGFDYPRPVNLVAKLSSFNFSQGRFEIVPSLAVGIWEIYWKHCA